MNEHRTSATESIHWIPLWPGGAPGALGEDDPHTPRLQHYRAIERNGAAVVVCPGGGYSFLALDHEGVRPAAFFNTLGIDAFVLHYRLGPTYRHPIMFNDISRAMRTVRARASELEVDPNRIGVMGFSAGGHLASTVTTQFDAGDITASDAIDHASNRPDLAMLIYPVITMTDITHGGSRLNLLGERPSAELIELMSNENRVTSQTPPTFLAHALDDTAVLPEHTQLFSAALLRHRVPHTVHYMERGGHGFGFGKTGQPLTDPVVAAWPDMLAAWLRSRGFFHPAK